MLPSPLDQNKLHWDSTRNEWNLYDANGDGVHSPGEAFFTSPPHGHDPLTDMSCWMASAANLLEYEGYSNPYLGWLQNGGAPSPNWNPWGNVVNANSSDAFTFDDAGYTHWALDQELGIGGAEVIVVSAFFPFPWLDDPVAWSLARLQGGHPVGLGFLTLSGAIHGITLWGMNIDLNTGLGTATITDSDDHVLGGTRTLNLSFTGSLWVLEDDGTWGGDALIGYATAIPEPSTAVLQAAALLALLAVLRRCSPH
jgi:hypothetical protein